MKKGLKKNIFYGKILGTSDGTFWEKNKNKTKK